MLELWNLGIKSVFIENILLAYFLGMCSFLACSRRMETAFGLGVAVIFVLGITTPVNWAVQHFLLQKGALAWAGFPDVDLGFLRFIAFIAVIATMVQIVEMLVDRFTPRLYASLGIFLPLIAVNCAILGASLLMAERDYGFAQSVVFGLGAGVGWALAIIVMAAMRKKLGYSRIPRPLQGLGITMMLTGMLAMGFMLFAGIRL